MDTTITQIEDALHTYCRAKIEDAKTIGSSAEYIWQQIDGYISGGGKRLRPRIFMMMHDFYSGTASMNGVLSVACAWELLHTSLLIHDDIIDRDIIRRGKLNIAGVYQAKYSKLTTDADHYALSAALLAGDLLLSSAYDIINQSDLTDSQKVAMQRHINKAVFAVGAGELLDTESALYPIASADPYSIAEYKTASYSFQFPMESGAALAGAPASELQKLHSVGSHAGIAFQLKDDLLGVFGDSAVTGKSNRSDIIEKKRTLLIQQVLKKATSEDADKLNQLYSSEHALTDEETEEVFRIIAAANVKNEIEAIIEEETERALTVVAALSVSGDNKEVLSGLIASLVGRRA